MPVKIKRYPLLEKAPDHQGPKFIDYLKKHNVVVAETYHWLIIENCKYHTKEKPWLTAFAKDRFANIPSKIFNPYKDWNWLKKSGDIQTVDRFHIHLYK